MYWVVSSLLIVPLCSVTPMAINFGLYFMPKYHHPNGVRLLHDCWAKSIHRYYMRFNCSPVRSWWVVCLTVHRNIWHFGTFPDQQIFDNIIHIAVYWRQLLKYPALTQTNTNLSPVHRETTLHCLVWIWCYHSDVIMSEVASLITSVSIVCSVFAHAQIKENIKAPHYWPL